MGGFSDDIGVDFDLPGSLSNDFADLAAGIEGDAVFCPNAGVIEILGAAQAAFLADGKGHLKGAVRGSLLLDGADCLDNSGDARFVVAAENGVAAAVDDSVADHRLDPAAGLDGVHVGRIEKNLAGQGSFKPCVDVEAVGTDGFPRAVGGNDSAERPKLLGHPLGHCLFVAGFTVDLHILQKRIQYTLLMNHNHQPPCFVRTADVPHRGRMPCSVSFSIAKIGRVSMSGRQFCLFGKKADQISLIFPAGSGEK